MVIMQCGSPGCSCACAPVTNVPTQAGLAEDYGWTAASCVYDLGQIVCLHVHSVEVPETFQISTVIYHRCRDMRQANPLRMQAPCLQLQGHFTLQHG